MLENASAKNADTAVAVQFDVSGEGCGAFYAVVSADSDKLTIEPYDYKGHDVLVSADAAELLDALRSAETDALTVEGDWDKVAVFREVLATLPTPKRLLHRRQRLRQRKPLPRLHRKWLRLRRLPLQRRQNRQRRNPKPLHRRLRLPQQKRLSSRLKPL